MRIAKGCLYVIRNMLLVSLIFFAFGALGNLLSTQLVAFFFLLCGVIFLLFTILLLFFFRDPDREVGEDIVAPADGKIIEIRETHDNEIGECSFVSIFMNVFDVHVNRCPISGRVKKIFYKPGKHLPAFSKKYHDNESNTILLETNIGLIKIVQVAGVFARRIVCYVAEGDEIEKGRRIGIIKFGSRVDLYLPKGKVKILGSVGLKVKAGVDTIAKIND